MTLIMATWAHGNAVVAQHPAGGALLDVDGKNYTAVIGYREGGTAVYEGTGSTAPQNSDTWFHISVPTVSWLPTMVGGGPSGRAFLENFSVLFNALNCSVTRIEAWDGNSLFAAKDQQMTGDWTGFETSREASQPRQPRVTNLFSGRELDSQRRSVRHPMLFGLGISLKVDFAWDAHPRRITFLGAGASWHDVAFG